MKTIEQISKINAVVLYILQQFKEGIDYIHLFKIMYFAQQSHLVKYGRPIMEDNFVALKHGPVPELTYKVLRCSEGKQVDHDSDLDSFISSLQIFIADGHQMVKAKGEMSPDMDEFSKSDIADIDATIQKYKDVEAFRLSNLSHDKAYQKAQQVFESTGETARIPLVRIAEAGGATKDMVNVIRNRQINKRELEWT